MSAARVAIIHDWLTGMRGGEAVLEAITSLFQKPEIFTLIWAPEKISPELRAYPTHASALQSFPGAVSKYRHFLPIMPTLIERFDLSDFDLIVSSSHCVAKGVRKAPHAVHLSYVHAPMRYMWDRYSDYFGPGKASLPMRAAARVMRSYLQQWDRRVSGPERVDQLIANSHFIAERIRDCYEREAEVIYPFFDPRRFHGDRAPGLNYLMVGAFAPYKRIDLAIEAFNRLKISLWIAGSGQDERRLRAMAGPTIKFLGAVTNEELTRLYSTCRAFVFPGVEDFGITPLEAMASGAPVIAYGEGGAAETVTERTGIFFRPQTAEALMDAVRRFEAGERHFDEADCRSRAQEFSRERFEREFTRSLRETWRKAGQSEELLRSALKH